MSVWKSKHLVYSSSYLGWKSFFLWWQKNSKYHELPIYDLLRKWLNTINELSLVLPDMQWHFRKSMSGWIISDKKIMHFKKISLTFSLINYISWANLFLMVLTFLYLQNYYFFELNKFQPMSAGDIIINLTKRSSATTLSMLLLPWRNFYEKMQVHCGIDMFYIFFYAVFNQKNKTLLALKSKVDLDNTL